MLFSDVVLPIKALSTPVFIVFILTQNFLWCPYPTPSQYYPLNPPLCPKPHSHYTAISPSHYHSDNQNIACPTLYYPPSPATYRSQFSSNYTSAVHSCSVRPYCHNSTQQSFPNIYNLFIGPLNSLITALSTDDFKICSIKIRSILN